MGIPRVGVQISEGSIQAEARGKLSLSRGGDYAWGGMIHYARPKAAKGVSFQVFEAVRSTLLGVLEAVAGMFLGYRGVSENRGP